MFDNGGMEYVADTQGGRRPAHREEVDVYARFGRDGSIDPVRVMWRDGRSFEIDEVLERGSFGAPVRGRQTARYRVRLGRHETFVYLERREPVPSLGEPERLVWWVYARDVTIHGRAPGVGCREERAAR